MVQTPTLAINASEQLADWLNSQKISLAFTTYQTNRLFFIGTRNGRIAAHERLFDKPMGLYAQGDRLYMSTRYQIWSFQNLLTPEATYEGCDCLYIPHHAQITGDVNIHDLAVQQDENVIFVNTDFSCLATLSPDYSFVPLWQPSFISQLAAEDRCHLNGLAMVAGKPAYVTACSATDTAASWRNHRQNGGIVMDVANNEIIATGLSMPHSPRWYQGKLWLLNSGTGELGYIEAGKFVPLTFCPGFVRGLAFWQHYAIVGLSKLRSSNFTGLALEKRLVAEGNTPRCGLLVIDLTTGEKIHALQFEGVIEELFDVLVLPGVLQPKAIGIQGDEIQRLVTFPNSGGIFLTKPTVNRSSLGKTPPVAGLPSEPHPNSLLKGEGAINYQRVYHLNPSNALTYDSLTFPSLQQRWQTQLPQGELIGIAASVSGAMVGFVVAECLDAKKAEILSLLVLPDYRGQGIGTKLLAYLEKELVQQGCQELILSYPVSFLSQATLEPLLKKLNWQPPEQSYPQFEQPLAFLSNWGFGEVRQMRKLINQELLLNA